MRNDGGVVRAAQLSDRFRALLTEAPASTPAVGAGDTWWTWSQIGRTAADVTQALERWHLPEGTRVGVALRNRPEYVAAVLAVLATHRCLTTINPLRPAEQLAADLERAAVSVLVTDSELPVPGLPDTTALILLGPDGAVQTRPGTAPAAHEPLPGTAIEMLTSGTTGPPKRIRLGYAQLNASLSSITGSRGSDSLLPRFSSAVSIVATPMVHISGLFHVINTIYSGRRLFLLDRFRVETWVAAVERYRPRTSGLVPAALRSVLDAGIDPARLTSLASVTAGTAPCPPDLADAFYQRFGIPVLANYGATEFAGAIAGWTLADHKQWWETKRGSVGRPFPGVQIQAVDQKSGDPLAPGDEGLLEIRSPQVGAGDWVRTSDLGRVDGDGFVWIDGRADDVIIRGGFKIHPGTVEKALRAYPGVRDAAVVGIPDARLGSVPAAVIELMPGTEHPDEADLLEFARQRLLPYEVPVELHVADVLPRTASLKVSRVDVLSLVDEARQQDRP
jgi:long-chain acyl-CoA synthetase